MAVPRSDEEALTLAMRVIDAQNLIINHQRTGSARGERRAIEIVRSSVPRLNEYLARNKPVTEPVAEQEV